MSKLIPLEFKNQRIITTKVLAEEFGTEDKIISNNFNRNIGRFVEGKHYYKLEGEELKEFKGCHQNDESLKYVSVLYLWTDRGAARHAKILDTDEAWDVYEALEENYFNSNEQKATCIEDILITQLQEMKSLKNEVQAIKQSNQETKEKLEGIKEVVALNSADWKKDSKNLIVRIAQKLGGNQFIQDVYQEIYANLEKRAGCQLEIRRTNKQKKMALEGASKSKINAVSKLDVIGDEKRLLECFLAIVKELAIKYGV